MRSFHPSSKKVRNSCSNTGWMAASTRREVKIPACRSGVPCVEAHVVIGEGERGVDQEVGCDHARRLRREARQRIRERSDEHRHWRDPPILGCRGAERVPHRLHEEPSEILQSMSLARIRCAAREFAEVSGNGEKKARSEDFGGAADTEVSV